MTRAFDYMAAAQEAIRAGDKQRARALLQQAVDDDPRNFRAWLWLAGLAGSAEASLEYAQRAQRLNPDDPAVQKAVTWAQRRVARRQEANAERQALASGLSASSTIAKGQASVSAVTQPEATTSQSVETLRERTRRTSPEDGRQRTPNWRRRTLVAFLIILATVAGAVLAWPMIYDSQATEGLALNRLADEGTSSATRTPAPTSGATRPAADAVAASFASGQFAAKSVADAPGDSQELIAQATATPLPLVIQPKPINRNDDNPRPTWTLTPSPTFTPTATPTPAPTFVSEERVVGGAQRPTGVGPNERWIDVNLTTQRLVAYEGDSAVFDTLVSSGTWLHPTVTGQFRVWLRYVAQTMDGRRLGYDYYLPNVPYVMYFYRDYALHGTYWHNNFGTPMSHGCVNLPTPAAEWIFNWSSIGTLVNVHY